MADIVEQKEKCVNRKCETSVSNVWRIVEGRKKTDDGKIVRFSIQEIPEDRYNDILDHLTKVFARDETMLSSFDTINNKAAMEDLRNVWKYCLQNGQVVGAFVLDDNDRITALAGVNMTLVSHGPDDHNFPEFSSEISKKIFSLFDELGRKYDTRKRYDVEKFITACGLVVDPLYRRQGVAFNLLQAREEMSKVYDIRASSTTFTCLAAQKTAEQAGFETIIEQKFSDVVDSDGNKIFPKVTTNFKFMGKRY